MPACVFILSSDTNLGLRARLLFFQLTSSIEVFTTSIKSGKKYYQIFYQIKKKYYGPHSVRLNLAHNIFSSHGILLISKPVCMMTLQMLNKVFFYLPKKHYLSPDTSTIRKTRVYARVIKPSVNENLKIIFFW